MGHQPESSARLVYHRDLSGETVDLTVSLKIFQEIAWRDKGRNYYLRGRSASFGLPYAILSRLYLSHAGISVTYLQKAPLRGDRAGGACPG